MSNRKEVHYYENFLPPDFCDWCISFHQTYYPFYGVEFANRRSLNIALTAEKIYNDEPKASSDYLKFVMSQHTNAVKKHDPISFINYSHIVEWQAPIHQPYHQDFFYHTWTSILYLNDEFEGGETYIEGELVKPKKGDMVLFQGRYIEHGVEPVTSGTRFTIATWYKTLNGDY